MTTILINEELGRIKNLFNYERGKVISEQDTTAPAAPAASAAPVATVEDLIKQVQTILNTKYGAKLTVDGKWGTLTQTAFENALKTQSAVTSGATTLGATTPGVATEPLDRNQTQVLKMVKEIGWTNEPAPTDVEVDAGLFEKMNLADPNSELGKTYSKYFPKFSTTGFFVYKPKTVAQPAAQPTTGNPVITTESCRTAIEGLYNNKRSPRTYPLSPELIAQYNDTVLTCAEPANKSKFLLKFGLEKKLREVLPK